MTYPTDYASLSDMQAWAHDIMKRPPDANIGDEDGPDYMHRWFVVPRNPFCGVYLHKVMRSDNAVPHDHPWNSRSLILEGGYTEWTAVGSFDRKPGDTWERKATDAHRLIVPDGGYAISLFTFGPKVREWGFICSRGWIPWQEFCDPADKGAVGRGCGE